MPKLLAAVLAGAVGLMLFPAACPATVTFGDSLNVPESIITTYRCGAPCTLATTTSPLHLAQFRAPISGIVVHWRIQTNAASALQKIRFRVLAPRAGGRFVGAGTSASVAVPRTAGTWTFPTHLRIAEGDYIGLDTQGGALGAVAVEEESIKVFKGRLPDFGSLQAGVPTDYALLLNADVVRARHPA